MSQYSVIDGVPHVVIGGTFSPEKGKSSLHFYRKGFDFTVDVSREDIAGTSFEEEWRDTLRVTEDGEDDWYERWDQQCLLVITQSLPLLAKLSQGDDRWQTVEDYLCTPHYEIKIKKSNKTGEAIAVLASGPITKPAFCLTPLPGGEDILDIPPELPRYYAVEVGVLDQKDYYRQPPHKVKLHDGTTPLFVPVMCRGMTMPGQTVQYHPLRKILAHLLSFKNKLSIGLPKVAGVVLTKTAPLNDRDIDTLPPGSAKREGDSVVGILLDYGFHAKRLSLLAGIASPIGSPPSLEKQPTPPTPELSQVKEWEKYLEGGLRSLHEKDMLLGDIRSHDIFISDSGPFFGILYGPPKITIPRDSQDFLEKQKAEVAEDAKLEEEGKSSKKETSSLELAEEEKKAMVGFRIDKLKQEDWDSFRKTFRQVRDALFGDEEM